MRYGYGKQLEEWNSILMASRISFVVGNGKRVLFMREKWCETEPLNVAFPSLYHIATCKDVLVIMFGVRVREGGVGIHC